MCGAEPWSEGMRDEIENVMGLARVDSYGLSEVIGPGVAQEFASENGTPHGLGGSLPARDHRSRDR